jgi:hypothetical protein
MSKLSDAILYMAAKEGMTDLFVWHTALSQSGNENFWSASCKIETRSCFVGHGADPIEAMLDALGQAWSAKHESP